MSNTYLGHCHTCKERRLWLVIGANAFCTKCGTSVYEPITMADDVEGSES